MLGHFGVLLGGGLIWEGWSLVKLSYYGGGYALIGAGVVIATVSLDKAFDWGLVERIKNWDPWGTDRYDDLLDDMGRNPEDMIIPGDPYRGH